jgi:hypothetical protein
MKRATKANAKGEKTGYPNRQRGHIEIIRVSALAPPVRPVRQE